MKTANWIVQHSEEDELVRVSVTETLPDGRKISGDQDFRMKDLPEAVAGKLRAGRDALVAHIGATWYEPPVKPEPAP